jgi:hypothetical protein
MRRRTFLSAVGSVRSATPVLYHLDHWHAPLLNAIMFSLTTS